MYSSLGKFLLPFGYLKAESSKKARGHGAYMFIVTPTDCNSKMDKVIAIQADLFVYIST